jgi:hypothetical protein
MSAAMQLATHVLGKRPYIRTLAALNRNFRLKPGQAQKFLLVNRDPSWGPFDLDALSGVFV